MLLPGFLKRILAVAVMSLAVLAAVSAVGEKEKKNEESELAGLAQGVAEQNYGTDSGPGQTVVENIVGPMEEVPMMRTLSNTLGGILDEATYGFIMALAPFPKMTAAFLATDGADPLDGQNGRPSGPLMTGEAVAGEVGMPEFLEGVSFLSSVATRSEGSQKRILGLIAKLFAGLFTAEVVFSAVYGYIQGKDSGVLKEVLAKAATAFLLFLLVSATPYLVEAFKAGFTIMAKSLVGAYDDSGGAGEYKKWRDEVLACPVCCLPGFVIRCYADICASVNIGSIGGEEIDLLDVAIEDKGKISGFLVKLLVNLLIFILRIVGFILTLFAALHVMLNICECYLLMGIVMLITPFSVFAPTKFIGAKALYSLFANVLELFVLMVVIWGSLPLAMSLSAIVTAELRCVTTSCEINVTWPKGNVYVTAFLTDMDDVAERCAELLADTFNRGLERDRLVEEILSDEAYGLADKAETVGLVSPHADSHLVVTFSPEDFYGVVGDSRLLSRMVDDLKSHFKSNFNYFTLRFSVDNEGKQHNDVVVYGSTSFFPSGVGGPTPKDFATGILERLNKELADNFSSYSLSAYRNGMAVAGKDSSAVCAFTTLPIDDKIEVLGKFGEIAMKLSNPLLLDLKFEVGAAQTEELGIYYSNLKAADSNALLLFLVFNAILATFILTYFINQSSQITNALLSGNVSSEGFSAAMGRMVAAKAGAAAGGAAGGLVKGAAGGIRAGAASHAVNRMAQGKSAGVSRFVAGSAAMRGAMQTYEFNEKMANLHSASRGASVEHPGQG